MFAEVTCGFRISGIMVAAHITAIATSLAALRSALKDMDTSAFDVLNGQSQLEEHINRQVPVLHKAL